MEEELLSLKWNNHKSTFFELLKILREKSNYTDATLAVEGKFYPVHKLVMSTCSEYFSDIFEKTPCKSPVIVLKDVRSHDIEALLDYMYLGEVNVNQKDLASLVKTAECLRIKGLAVPDEDPTTLRKSSSSSQNDAPRDSPPPKRRRENSNTISPRASTPVPSLQNSGTALVSLAQTPSIFSHSAHSTSNTEQDELPVVKVEIDDADEQEGICKRERENNYEGGASRDQDSLGDYGADVSMTEHEHENYVNTSFPGPSLPQSEGMSLFEFEKSYLMSIGVALKEASGGNDSHLYIQCKLCNKNIKSDRMRRHVGAHILAENLQYRCGFCGGPNENCENKLIPTNKSKGVQYYKVSSNCCYKILYKKRPDTLSKRNKCTNHVLVCPRCPSFQWKYNLPDHYADCHDEYDIPVELTISSEEWSTLKKCYMSY